MARNEKDQDTKLVKSAPVNGADTTSRDPFAVLDEIGEAFKDVPAEEIEREVAKAVGEVREEMQAERQGNRKAPKSAFSLAGAWSDLDWDETAEALDRIRHESTPTPPIDLELEGGDDDGA